MEIQGEWFSGPLKHVPQPKCGAGIYAESDNPPHQAEQLLTAIFGDYFSDDRHEDYIVLASKKAAKLKLVYFASLHDAIYRVHDYSIDGADAYFYVAPRRKRSTAKQAISRILVAHVDIDCGKREIKSAEANLKPLKPSAVVMTGNGLHGYWFLAEPIPATPDNIRLIEGVNKQIRALTRGDSATDISRMLRLPGTYNNKNPSKPILAELLELYPTRRYAPEELAARFRLNDGGPQILMPRERKGRARFGVKGEDAEYLNRLLNEGLFEASSRNKATLLLTRYCYGEGMAQAEAESFLTDWFDRNHNGRSKDWPGKRRACIGQIKSCVKNWYEKAGNLTAEPHNDLLSERDIDYVNSLGLDEKDAAFVIAVLTYTLNNHRDGVIYLPFTNVLSRMPGVNTYNYRKKWEMLTRLGLLELISSGDQKKRLATEFRVIYMPTAKAKRVEIQHVEIQHVETIAAPVCHSTPPICDTASPHVPLISIQVPNKEHYLNTNKGDVIRGVNGQPTDGKISTGQGGRTHVGHF
ncbi:MAG TPA: hypothetical protein VNO70_14805 [Blastocatellia bacterium]|nr:hypothetical protein [Blastocatellia bacterium]